MEGPGDPELPDMIVKKIRLNDDGSFDRLVSEYSRKQEDVPIGPEQEPRVDGKVVGIFRPFS
jgi:hypothetical protein